MSPGRGTPPQSWKLAISGILRWQEPLPAAVASVKAFSVIPTRGCRSGGIALSLPCEGWQHLFGKQPHLPVNLIDPVIAEQPHVSKRAHQMVEPGLRKLFHRLGHGGHGAAQELMFFPKEPSVMFHGVRPDVRWHDTDELKRPIAAMGTNSGDAIFQLLGRHGPWDPPISQSCCSPERWGGHTSDQQFGATRLRRLWKACDVCKR